MSKADCRTAWLAAVVASALAGGCGSGSSQGNGDADTKTTPTPDGGTKPNVSNPETGLAPGGVDWTQRTSGTQSGLIAVTSGHDLIVVVGNNGVVLTSPDGVEWTKRPTEVNVALNDVIWTGDQFLAVGDSGTILTSPDGQAWTQRNTSNDYHLQSVAWNGKIFVTVGGRMVNSALSTPAILTSPDCKTWTKQSGGDGILYGVAWGGFVFLAVGYNYDFSTVSDLSRPEAYVSLDGVQWDYQSPNVKDYNAFDKVIYDGKQFVTSGGSRRTDNPFGTIYFTKDFDTWKSAYQPAKDSLRDLAFTGSEYIAVGKKGAIVMADAKGASWTMRTSGTTENLNGVAATSVGWQLVAVGDSGTLLTSPCGKKEASSSTSNPDPLVGVWKQDKDIIRHADGSETTPSGVAPVQVYSFAEDQSMMIYLLDGTRLGQALEGTWKTSGSKLTLTLMGTTVTLDYTLAGNTLTLIYPETVDNESVTRKQTFLRQ